MCHAFLRFSRNSVSDHDSSNNTVSLEIPEAGAALATMIVRDDMANGFNVCHGGLVFTLADTAFAFACNAYNRETLSANAKIKWLLPTRPGDRLVATAAPASGISISIPRARDEASFSSMIWAQRCARSSASTICAPVISFRVFDHPPNRDETLLSGSGSGPSAVSIVVVR